ncbi:bifunctional DNA-formamidopyrimidine glycosylase/DNA-(apurinic or apyrimidinic site) lyase [Staphylococcus sp. NRL 16/872]|uniref:bifunctional DNA-formamidopyrimidine glycosylase/DNA-(apurinic or apyrimidinic site) lyase n=1 Tax=Staphylococcus sp. NRL 16/872 TaxID=2930131 RepID=UPI001FB3B75B|nr:MULTISPECIES: bifunctional DNA-formamidopyrimidine glycosylase/DNA-(apurinic or apyrimidinic site) lyase [unclassified Staphylococcus]MCJ1656157.1 bifunctional DNA-formamidopyrimidine glycosylase/DNA-(apurinic or apyrimidinic site) lyase [Staphylococcus sp. NRL 21/187]MCJ1667977.1 bifunctional DNA-formamidopyrimidine glycosylase/DNA-(apurinic or apyrimidinic site) lyase [Staphylococcus sp. NRL 19/737]WEN70466.1 bifunctional DNA-formamidopyrimidine glycosylase/DNA-(apurinic or apyrimidinic sit
MPELPEVEHVKRGIEPFIQNTTIKSVTFSKKVIEGKQQGKETIIKGINLDGFRLNSEGYTFKNIERRSKYIVFTIEKNNNERILLSHLGMAGGFFTVNQLSEISTPNYRKHWHVIFHLDNGKKLVYSDIRRFGEIRNLASFNDYPSFLEIAPEPFEEEAFEHFKVYLTQKKVQNKPIKQMLLDHKIVAGCGNIYACEALFRAGILPSRKVKYTSEQERQMLFYYVQEVLKEGINNGGTSISDYRHADGKTGEMQLHLNVYKQKKCKVCNHDIEQKVVATRNSHFCPQCQK